MEEPEVIVIDNKIYRPIRIDGMFGKEYLMDDEGVITDLDFNVIALNNTPEVEEMQRELREEARFKREMERLQREDAEREAELQRELRAEMDVSMMLDGHNPLGDTNFTDW